jgi:hypothetical protein
MQINESPLLGLQLFSMLGDMHTDDSKEEKIAAQSRFDSMDLAGKRFSLENYGEPEFIVFADNKTLKKTIVRRYGSATKDLQTILRTLKADYLYAGPKGKSSESIDPIIAEFAKSDQPSGWTIYAPLLAYFKTDLSHAESLAPFPKYDEKSQTKRLQEFFLVERALENFKPPAERTTEESLKKVARGDCVLDFLETIEALYKYEWSSPQFGLAAACHLTYAKSGKRAIYAGIIGGYLGFKTGGIAGAAATAPAGGEGALAAIPAALGGAMAAVWWSEALFRVLPMIWGFSSGNEGYGYAQLAIIILEVILGFVEWRLGTSLKFLFSGGPTTALATYGKLLELGVSTGAAQTIASLIGRYGTLSAVVTAITQSTVVSALAGGVNTINIDPVQLTQYLVNPELIKQQLSSGDRLFAEYIDRYPKF